MSVTEVSSAAASQSTSTFTLHVAIGQFFLIILIITELVLRPLQELFKDDMVHCAARSAVAKGNAVRIRSAPLPFRAFGIHTLITGRGYGFIVTQVIRAALMLLLIAAAALFDRKIDESKLLVVSTFSTTSLQGDLVNVSEGHTILMSPFPIVGINEEDAGDIAAFSPTGSNSSSHYAVRENPNLAAQFISNCVRQVNDSYTIVHVGAVIEAEGVPKVRCLDGSSDSDNRTAAVFFSNPPPLDQPFVQTITLLPLRNENNVSSDGVSGVFGADVLDENGVRYEGYVAVTRRSHFDSNVEWSMYGLLRTNGPFVYRLNVRLYLARVTDPGSLPCFGEHPSSNYVGEWSFSDSEYTCPDGEPRAMSRRENEELQTISLEIFAANPQVQFEENGDLLAWLLETDYARFAAAQTFALEVRTRVRSDRMFYSLHEGEQITVTTGEVVEIVTIGLWETWVLLAVVGMLFVSIMFAHAWKLYQRRTLGVESDVVSIESVASMYAWEVRKCDYPGKTLLQVGLKQEDDGVARLGIVEKDAPV